MRIKMLTPIAGTNWRARIGEYIDVDRDTAARLITAGLAQYETAAVEPSENAAIRTKKPTGRRRN